MLLFQMVGMRKDKIQDRYAAARDVSLRLKKTANSTFTGTKAFIYNKYNK